MRLAPESCAIVLVGAWNRTIFTPEWTSEKLFGGIVPEVELAFPAFTLRFTGRACTLTVQAGRVELAPRSEADEAFDAARDVALMLLKCLTETPMKGLGVNFRFSTPHPSEALVRYRDATLEPGPGISAAQVAFVAPPASDSSILNLILSFQDAGEAAVDANFHFAVTSASDAENQLAKASMAAMRKVAEEHGRRLLREEAS